MKLVAIVAVSIAAGWSARAPQQRSATLEKAVAFLASLNPEQRTKALRTFDDETRTTWAYTPVARAGIPLKQLAPPQSKAALELLKASLSESGFAKAEAIRADLEGHLREIEGNPGRDPEMYYFAFFGQPSPLGKWGWRYEGHHVSLSFTYVEGKIVATTPQFLGSNPAEIREGPKKGLRVLGQEEAMGRELVVSLSAEQRKDGIIASTAPADIITSNQRKAAMLDDKGIGLKSLSKKQVELLKGLVRVYADIQKEDQSKARLSKIEKSGWDKVKFAWMGGTEPGQGHYYRIQGPTFLIEYDNTQNGANHVHTVWRDFAGDFGRDALLEHYQKAEHHRRSDQPSLAADYR